MNPATRHLFFCGGSGKAEWSPVISRMAQKQDLLFGKRVMLDEVYPFCNTSLIHRNGTQSNDL